MTMLLLLLLTVEIISGETHTHQKYQNSYSCGLIQ